MNTCKFTLFRFIFLKDTKSFSLNRFANCCAASNQRVSSRQKQANHLLNGKAGQGKEHHWTSGVVWPEQEAEGPGKPCCRRWPAGRVAVQGPGGDRRDQQNAQPDRQVPAERTDPLDQGTD